MRSIWKTLAARILFLMTILALMTMPNSVFAEETNKDLLGVVNSSKSKNSSPAPEENLANEQLIATIHSLPCKSTDFGLKLFTQVARENKGNVVVSPFSAYAALSMALNGSSGNTRSIMSKVLGVNSETIGSLNKRNQAVLKLLANNGGKVKLEIGNAVFADVSTPFKNSFIDICKQFYDAEIQNVNFKNTNTLNIINGWCNTKTHGKIPTIIDRLNANEKMVLLNAVYFKGAWASVFKKENTQSDKFITPSGNITDVEMMNQHEQLYYLKGQDFQAVSIPYAGRRQSLQIFLPNKGIELSVLQSQFTQDNWDKWTGGFHSADVNLSLPKFTIEFSKDLSPSLEALGMANAFDRPKANFSDLVSAPYRSWISRVLQKTYLDVNEEGTEAAAATAVIMGVCKAVVVQAKPIDFRVDHPFVLALVDNETQEILFLGSIVQP